jgi:fatty-acyl-CoA synthase
MNSDSTQAAQIRRARGQQLGDILRRSASRDPDKVALVFRSQSDTYAELNNAVTRAANALAAQGIAKGDHVAMLSHNNRTFVVLRFALAKLGAILTPINFMLNADDIAYILDHSGATTLISEDKLCDVAEAAMAILNLTEMQTYYIPNTGADVWMDVSQDDPIQMMYTSGTESRPKGALQTSSALFANYVSNIVNAQMSANAVSLHCLPLFHCAQLDTFLTPDLYQGATSILHEKADPAAMLAAIEAEGVTQLFCPPTIWISLLRHPDFDKRDLSSLVSGYYGASIMPTAIIKELLSRLPQIKLYNLYGQTEMSPTASVLLPADQLRKLGSAGKATLNVETRIVDYDDRTLPVGEVGEIVHRSPQLILGYYKDPDKTAEAFKDGWFHSGDLGRMDDEGYLYVVDRKKDMIKTGGENVASREVEEAIFHHPDVAEVAVFGVPHPTWIEAVTAIVVPKPGTMVTPEQLTIYCRENLAGFKSPKHFDIVDDLPRNASGKILKRDLRLQYQDVFSTP